MSPQIDFSNPFRPGAGHKPPYLAGRSNETSEFSRLSQQDIILENMVLTGLRGVGKTVLLDTFKPLAIRDDWLWVGTDLSETASINEDNIAIRLLTDLSVVTSNIVIGSDEKQQIGFGSESTTTKNTLNFETLKNIYANTPGLAQDKLKRTLNVVWNALSAYQINGIIFAYDEAQNLSDHAQKEQFPLSLLLDVFQSIQKAEVPFMLVLTGLPTLFPKLVESRTFSERMFRVVFLDRLNKLESRDAVLKPIEQEGCPVQLSDNTVDLIVDLSGGYPYFIQFICREIYDAFLQKSHHGEKMSIPTTEIIIKLDTDFFAGRWSRSTDRQRALLYVISQLKNCDNEFTVQEVVDLSKTFLQKSFSNSHVNQMLNSLSKAGLVYKNRHGRYSFAVPLLGQFIERQPVDDINIKRK